jgi:hypothetical protein
MNSQAFIIANINRIVKEFPFVQCTYQFDRFCGLHTVEVLPKGYLNDTSSFGELQFGITKEFISLFSFERLSFFSTDNSIGIEIENVVCTVRGKCFSATQDIEVFPDYRVHISNFDADIDKDGNYAVAA